MIVVMKAGSSEQQLEIVLKEIESCGYRPHLMRGVERNVIGCLGDERGKSQLKVLETLAGVESVMPILTPYKLAGKTLQKEPTVIKISDNLSVGSNQFLMIAGPCSVENEKQIIESAHIVKNSGGNALRGGAYKPRSSTYSFQGLGVEGLKLLKKAKDETGLPIVTELVDKENIDVVCEYADVLQIGARNMQNFSLLKAVGKTKKPVLLKRGLMCTIEEFLLASEYILAEGNPNVILCERGIRTFETATRNTLDLNAVPAIQARSHLPIIVDPSHGTGVASYVPPLSKAAVSVGAAGLIVEVHPKPLEALSDGKQSLDENQFAKLMTSIKVLLEIEGKTL